MAWRWSNVPVPETHVAALIGAAILRIVAPIGLPLRARSARILGLPMLAGGIGLAAWAVASAGDADVEGDAELVDAGAYAHSRNPMYVGWTAAVLGIAIARRDAWLLAGLLLAARALHDEVMKEETRLAKRFGAAYTTYRERVPRYVPPRARSRPG